MYANDRYPEAKPMQGYTAVGQGYAEPQAQSTPLEGAMHSLAGALDDATATADALAHRLHPVMLPPAPSGESKPSGLNAVATNSSHVAQVFQQAERVKAVTRQMHDIMNRLEV